MRKKERIKEMREHSGSMASRDCILVPIRAIDTLTNNVLYQSTRRARSTNETTFLLIIAIILEPIHGW